METLSDSPSPRHSPAPRSGDRIGSKLCLVGAEQFRTAAALRRFRTAIDAGCQFDIPNCPHAGRLLYLFKPRLDPLYHQKNKISARRRFKPDRIDPDKLIRHTQERRTPLLGERTKVRASTTFAPPEPFLVWLEESYSERLGSSRLWHRLLIYLNRAC